MFKKSQNKEVKKEVKKESKVKENKVVDNAKEIVIHPNDTHIIRG